MSALPRFMISAAHKSSGKTVVSTGLARAFSDRGHTVGTFKKGPDYIDPLWMSSATRRPCHNLDFNSMGHDEIASTVASRATPDINLIEANKGLFDGIAVDGSDSNAALAKLLKTPVILVIDTVGMTRGVAPLLQGYAGFDPDVQIAGVILNRTGGPRHEAKLRQSVETYTDLPVLGAIRRSADMIIDERHLGLITPAENPETERWLDLVAELVSEQVDLEVIASVAKSAPDLSASPNAEPPKTDAKGLRIGIARDGAFGFYYAQDLEAFEAAGATLVPIDMMQAKALPDIDGLFIGGGYPETHMKALEANVSLRAELRTAPLNGLTCYAECGGLMYLCRSIQWNGESSDTVGFFDADAVMHKKPQGRGYARFSRNVDHPWGASDTEMCAHEFHYARLANSLETDYCRTVTRGFGTDGKQDGLLKVNTLAGFIHLKHSTATPWVTDFLNFVKSCKK